MTDYILIVEDDQNLAVTIEMVLEVQGYVCKIARNGRDALEVVAEQMPSLIILDMLMPIMGGAEFGRELRLHYPRPAPILVLTAAENARARGAEIGAAVVLAKPFDVKQLLNSIEDLLAEQRRLDASMTTG